jgi:hypothetical protein
MLIVPPLPAEPPLSETRHLQPQARTRGNYATISTNINGYVIKLGSPVIDAAREAYALLPKSSPSASSSSRCASRCCEPSIGESVDECLCLGRGRRFGRKGLWRPALKASIDEKLMIDPSRGPSPRAAIHNRTTAGGVIRKPGETAVMAKLLA